MAQIGTLKIYHSGAAVTVPVFEIADVSKTNIRVKVGGQWGVLNMVNDGSGDLPIKAKIGGVWYQAKSTVGGGGGSTLNGYALDDWADGKYQTARDDFATTPFVGTEPASSAYTTNTRPLWFDEQGGQNVGVNALITINNQSIASVASFQSTFVEGTWEIGFRANSVMYSGHAAFTIMGQDHTPDSYRAYPDNCYFVYISSSELFMFRKYVSGAGTTLIAGSGWTPDIAHHTIKVTRDASGNFEFWLDGVSQGTINDTAFTTSTYVMVGSSKEAPSCFWDNLRIY